MASHQRDDLKDVPPGRAGSAALYVLLLVVFVGGFSLMSFAFEIGSPLLFSAGLLASAGIWLVPMGLLGRPR